MIHDEMYYGDFPSDPEFEEAEMARENPDQHGWMEDGEPVFCDNHVVKFDGTKWYCDQCYRTWNREEWFSEIGAELPSEKCRTCTMNYPDCKWCCVDDEVREIIESL